jgi:hypothetical protein
MSETIIHPETGAILRRRKRMETVTHQGQSRTVEVEGWFPDDEGDGILVGADSKPLDAALAEMKAGWPDPARPGVPLNPEQRGWHWLSCQNMPFLIFWDGEVLQDALSGQRMKPDVLSAVYSYFGPCLTPAEVESHKHAAVIAYANLLNLPTPPNLIAQARRDAREQVARYHDLMAKMAGSSTELQRRSSWVHSESAKDIRSGIDIRVLGEKEAVG